MLTIYLFSVISLLHLLTASLLSFCDFDQLLHIEQEKQHVSSLRKALASSGIRGAVGRLNTSHINFTELQTAIKRCSHSSLKTVQARSLLRVAKGLYDVRYAVSQNGTLKIQKLRISFNIVHIYNSCCNYR
mgnify:CR=1 FL=1|jgi:hypothetical protein|tara:strand:+ start:44 stop:436 length:393 start_codon:yes stop_codon:yes gene_type:complete